MNLSVILCTYNRGALIADALNALAQMDAPPNGRFEIIVVDNNSTDGTRSVIEEYARSHPGLLTYVFEGRQGKSAALNAGMAASKGEVLAFTDDDCIVDRDWGGSILREFHANPELGALGGRIELYSPDDIPITIRTERDRRSLGIESVGLTNPPIVGANWAIARRVIDAIGNFDVFFGPGAPSEAVAEDLDLLYRMVKRGFEVVYVPEALVLHNHGRSTDAAIAKQDRTYLLGRGALYCKHILSGDPFVMRAARREFAAIARDVLRNWAGGRSAAKGLTSANYLLRGMWRRLSWNMTRSAKGA